ncbi:MAG: hypothetical protein IPO29_09180 [Anaerolineae bacterium]|nr:hypothetical protein [Anaerolineae bacterium]
MKELPFSIGVISFVAGLVLLIAAIAGQKIEIAAVKLPEIVDAKRRFVVGVLGAVLIGFGMWDGTPPAFLRPGGGGRRRFRRSPSATGVRAGRDTCQAVCWPVLRMCPLMTSRSCRLRSI